MRLLLILLLMFGLHKQTLPPVNVTGVYVNNNSVKIDFQPVKGARDYRIVNLANPSDVKYAGVWHLSINNTTVNTPATEIEVNNIVPGQPVTLEVQALNILGPVPGGNLTNINNTAYYPSLVSPDSRFGSNMGMTTDGFMSTNGQGAFNNQPTVIAQSAPFTVQCSGIKPIPSGFDSTQSFFDDFGDNQMAQTTIVAPDPVNQLAQYLMKTTAGMWDVFLRGDDVKDTSFFVANRHFMDIMFDGGTPGSNNPLHVSHGLLSVSPQQTFDFSNGQILHITCEVDAHQDGRRWIGFTLAPANDPLNNWYEFQGAMNNTDFAVLVNFSGPILEVMHGPTSSTDNNPVIDRIIGAAGQGDNYAVRPIQNYQYGHGLDNRSRFDLFISQSHFAYFEDGINIGSYDIGQGGIPFTNAKVYFSDYLYHTAQELQDLKSYASYETYWIKYFPYSNERHWANMGAEVLPASTSWSTIQQRIKMPILSPVTSTTN